MAAPPPSWPSPSPASSVSNSPSSGTPSTSSASTACSTYLAGSPGYETDSRSSTRGSGAAPRIRTRARSPSSSTTARAAAASGVSPGRIFSESGRAARRRSVPSESSWRVSTRSAPRRLRMRTVATWTARTTRAGGEEAAGSSVQSPQESSRKRLSRFLVPGADPQEASAGPGRRGRRYAASESSVGKASGRGGDGGRIWCPSSIWGRTSFFLLQMRIPPVGCVAG
uniref:Uncharacterized protein n=1 Tax=Triticum urartu TaxID=4572 RepID=A0A8R7VC89_TRIUA